MERELRGRNRISLSEMRHSRRYFGRIRTSAYDKSGSNIPSWHREGYRPHASQVKPAAPEQKLGGAVFMKPERNYHLDLISLCAWHD